MVKPASLWAFIKATADTALVGRVCRAVGGQKVEGLNPAEAALVSVISQDGEWMDERLEDLREKERERKAAYRKAKCPEMSQGQDGTPGCPGDKTVSQGQSGVPHPPSVRPSLRPSVPPNNTNRSVPLRARSPQRNGTGNNDSKNGTDTAFDEKVKAFVQDARSDDGAWFDPRHEAEAICAAITGDRRSRPFWMKAVRELGDEVVRQEAYTYRCEIAAGEEPRSRAKAFTARLKRLMTN